MAFRIFAVSAPEKPDYALIGWPFRRIRQAVVARTIQWVRNGRIDEWFVKCYGVAWDHIDL